MNQITFKSLVSPQSYLSPDTSIYFSTILLGQAQGIIWGNKQDTPDMLLVWSEYQKDFQLLGQALPQREWPAFRNWFEEALIPFIKSKGVYEFEYGAENEELAKMMAAIFSDKEIACENQKIFSFSGKQEKQEAPLGYRCEKVDREFLQKDYQNIPYIVEEIESAYGTQEMYIEKGYGYAAIKDNAVVARAIMTFTLEEKSNISVDTMESHRKKGLSSYLTSRTIEEALKRNEIPIWDCTQFNIASEKTAEKCGMKLVGEEPIYWFSL